MKKIPKPRLIKTHLPATFFKRQLEGKSTCPKFVVVMRNPKDLLTSYYHFHKSWPAEFAFPKDWNYYFGMFKEKRLDCGDCLEHMSGWWNHKNHSNVLAVTYEDMKKDAKGNIQKVGEFLGSLKYSSDDFDMIVDETSFNKMRTRPITKTFQGEFMDTAGFFRKGTVGSWKEFFQPEQEEYVDKRVHSELNSVGLSFT